MPLKVGASLVGFTGGVLDLRFYASTVRRFYLSSAPFFPVCRSAASARRQMGKVGVSTYRAVFNVHRTDPFQTASASATFAPEKGSHSDPQKTEI